ncbi:MAG: hypothetical protein F4226_09955 [Synechococcus sp. SB0678_bin_12]|nr:hypothetical protein [Synechococcus sp. SB0678_bin_12]MYI88514.1 hypothetical protein [Synechococcus sp. SB0672_bin_10]
MSIPANATEAPSITKVWRQVKGNAPTFATIWGLILITAMIDFVFSRSLHYLLNGNVGEYQATDFTAILMVNVSSLPTTILANLAGILMTAIAVIYYATNYCPKSGEIVSIITRKPLRYVLAGFLFLIAVGTGLLLCIIPGILVALAQPLYVYYVFTTDLDLMTCLSKAFKGMFQDFGSYFLVSLLCFLALAGSIILCVFPVLVVYPMTELYMQNYIHYKGLVRARELV